MVCGDGGGGIKPLIPGSTLLFFVGLRRFPRQALSLQSFIISPEGFLRLFVFCRYLPFAGVLKSPSRLSLREVLTCSIAHRSHPILSDQSKNDSSATLRRKKNRRLTLMLARIAQRDRSRKFFQ